ncbi:MAG: hypothetical protein ACOC2F_02695 [Bacteroidota bacterium]
MKIAVKEADETEYGLLLSSVSKTCPKNPVLLENLIVIIRIITINISTLKTN